jgi:hypothetical protein
MQGNEQNAHNMHYARNVGSLTLMPALSSAKNAQKARKVSLRRYRAQR